ncbi:MFS transporter [Actinacidiphila glaucinigra]|uniref:Major Facilitator Superfamily protein n=1 Tax=Actinacidiphila glaucinigra TaxID=235986 RepID=A0A239DSB9_9ACTN|nr:MFS transporter [Actinacidiphila glaucinigra]SNS34633.1 Major Facilitator Superfamily protein [Actinacidiphila glaucinigra]
MENPATGEPRSGRQRALVPVLISLGLLVAVVSSLGAPLVPTVAAEEHVSLGDAQWSLTVTLLVGALVTPVMGRLGDGPRRRAVMLGALVAVLTGCVLAALPLGIGCLLTGRALQGIGLGLVPLAIATARDALPPERSRPAVAMLSITTVAGVGLGYPVTGLIAQSFGLYAGYWFGAAVSAAALVAAALVLPPSPSRPAPRLDVAGALLLGGALAGLLLALGEAELWGWSSWRLLTLAGISALLLGAWVVHESRTAQPLVDLRLIRDRTVLTAHVTALVAGVGMYLLVSLATRFAQTPRAAGYGFGASVAVTGLVLLPYSLASTAAGRIVPLLVRRAGTALVLPVGCAVSLAAVLAFALARGQLWELFAVMTVAGFGIGWMFALLPGLIVGSVPAHETGSAMSFNQVLRYVGYSTGSVLSATVLQAHTATGHALPTGDGYRTAALLACAVWLAMIVVTAVLPPRRRRGAVATPLPGAAAGPRTPDEDVAQEVMR